MSRYSITMSNQATPIEAVVGFDDRLDEFFLDVYQHGDMLYTGLSELGDKDSLWLAKRLAAYDIVLPAEVYSGLMLGAMGLARAFNAQNAMASFDISSLTPLQAQLVKMKGLQLLQSYLTGGDIPVLWLVGPADDAARDTLQFCGLQGAAVQVVLPAFLVPQHLQGNTPPELTDDELLALLQAAEPTWSAHLAAMETTVSAD